MHDIETIKLPQCSWQEAMHAVEYILPTIISYQQPKRELPYLQSERMKELQAKMDEKRLPIRQNRARLLEEGKIINTKGYFTLDMLWAIAKQEQKILKEEVWGSHIWDIGVTNLIDRFLGDDWQSVFKEGQLILVADICYPKIANEYKDCEYEHHKPFIFPVEQLRQVMEVYDYMIYGNDAILIDPLSSKILVLHHEGAAILIGESE